MVVVVVVVIVVGVTVLALLLVVCGGGMGGSRGRKSGGGDARVVVVVVVVMVALAKVVVVDVTVAVVEISPTSVCETRFSLRIAYLSAPAPSGACLASRRSKASACVSAGFQLAEASAPSTTDAVSLSGSLSEAAWPLFFTPFSCLPSLRSSVFWFPPDAAFESCFVIFGMVGLVVLVALMLMLLLL